MGDLLPAEITAIAVNTLFLSTCKYRLRCQGRDRNGFDSGSGDSGFTLLTDEAGHGTYMAGPWCYPAANASTHRKRWTMTKVDGTGLESRKEEGCKYKLTAKLRNGGR